MIPVPKEYIWWSNTNIPHSTDDLTNPQWDAKYKQRIDGTYYFLPYVTLEQLQNLTAQVFWVQFRPSQWAGKKFDTQVLRNQFKTFVGSHPWVFTMHNGLEWMGFSTSVTKKAFYPDDREFWAYRAVALYVPPQTYFSTLDTISDPREYIDYLRYHASIGLGLNYQPSLTAHLNEYDATFGEIYKLYVIRFAEIASNYILAKTFDALSAAWQLFDLPTLEAQLSGLINREIPLVENYVRQASPRITCTIPPLPRKTDVALGIDKVSNSVPADFPVPAIIQTPEGLKTVPDALVYYWKTTLVMVAGALMSLAARIARLKDPNQPLTDWERAALQDQRWNAFLVPDLEKTKEAGVPVFEEISRSNIPEYPRFVVKPDLKFMTPYYLQVPSEIAFYKRKPLIEGGSLSEYDLWQLGLGDQRPSFLPWAVGGVALAYVLSEVL